MPVTFVLTELTPQAISTDASKVTTSRVFDLAYSSGVTIAEAFATIGVSGGLPARGDAHPLFSGMYCDKITLEPDGGGQDWTATADYSYSNDVAQSTPADLSTKVPVVRTTFIPYEYPILATNSAHEAFDPPVIDQQFNLILDIEKYYSKAGMTPTIADGLINSVNSGSVTVAGRTIAHGFGLIRAIDLEQNTGANSTVYTRAHIQIEISRAESGWTQLIRDQGLNQVISGYLRPCLDGEGNPVVDPVRLNGSGIQLDPATADSGTVYIARQTKPVVAWTPLSLPTDW